jgi:hypothetical protein
MFSRLPVVHPKERLDSWMTSLIKYTVYGTGPEFSKFYVINSVKC